MQPLPPNLLLVDFRQEVAFAGNLRIAFLVRLVFNRLIGAIRPFCGRRLWDSVDLDNTLWSLRDYLPVRIEEQDARQARRSP